MEKKMDNDFLPEEKTKHDWSGPLLVIGLLIAAFVGFYVVKTIWSILTILIIIGMLALAGIILYNEIKDVNTP